MKVLKSKLLFCLAVTSRLDSRAGSEEMFNLEELYWRLGEFAKSSVRAAVGELLAEGLLGKVTRKGENYFRMTGVGRSFLNRDFGWLGRDKKVWDKGYRLVIADRKILGSNDWRYLENQLARLGLARINSTVWFTPLDRQEKVKEMMMDRKITRGVLVMVSRKFVFGDEREMVERLFGVSKRALEYEVLAVESSKTLRLVRSSKVINGQIKKRWGQLLERWRQLLLTEPGLPKALLPQNYGFDESAVELWKLSRAIVELEREGD